MTLTIIYYNYDTSLDRKIGKAAGIAEKSKIFSGVDGGRSIVYSFNTIKALNVAKKAIQKVVPESANLRTIIVK